MAQRGRQAYRHRDAAVKEQREGTESHISRGVFGNTQEAAPEGRLLAMHP